MRTTNPTLSGKTFENLRVTPGNAMTLEGTVRKTGILAFLVICGGLLSWQQVRSGHGGGGLILAGALGGFIVAMITVFKKEWSPITAPIYAILEGLLLGAISAVFETSYKGIVFAACGLTVSTLCCLLLAYQSGLIRPTENLKLGIIAATGGIFLLYVVDMILGFFGVHVPALYSSGWFGIGLSLLIVIVAAMNLILDFDFIEQGAAQGAPKYMEWYGAFGLMVTLIWLYLEILRLLSKVMSRR